MLTDLIPQSFFTNNFPYWVSGKFQCDRHSLNMKNRLSGEIYF